MVFQINEKMVILYHHHYPQLLQSPQPKRGKKRKASPMTPDARPTKSPRRVAPTVKFLEMTRTSWQLHHDGDGVEGKQDHKV